MCIGLGTSIPLLNDADKYNTFIPEDDVFAGEGYEAVKKTYKTIGKGIIYIDETIPSGLPTCDAVGDSVDGGCKSSEVAVSYCTKEVVSKLGIYKSDPSGGKCNLITKTDHGEITYYKKDYDRETTVTLTSKIRYAYKCTFDGNGKADECTLLRGYTISGSYVVMCSGSKYDDCIVSNKGSTSACKATANEGSIKSGGLAVCFGTNEVTLPTAAATAPNYIAFKSTGLNPAYGVQADGKYVLMELTSNYAVKVTTYPGKKN